MNKACMICKKLIYMKKIFKDHLNVLKLTLRILIVNLEVRFNFFIRKNLILIGKYTIRIDDGPRKG